MTTSDALDYYDGKALLGTLIGEDAMSISELLSDTLEREELRARRSIDPANSFPVKPSEYGDFVPFPVVLKAFMFKLLTAPEVRCYLLTCLVAVGFRTGTLTGADARRATGLKSNKAVYGPTKALEAMGFILMRRLPIVRGDPKTVRMFHRPALEFTLLTLLGEKYIDEDFRALKTFKGGACVKERMHWEQHGPAIEACLKNILGETAYAKLPERRKASRRAALITELEAALDRRKKQNEAQSQDYARRKASGAKKT